MQKPTPPPPPKQIKKEIEKKKKYKEKELPTQYKGTVSQKEEALPDLSDLQLWKKIFEKRLSELT